MKIQDGYDKHESSKILWLRGMGLWDNPFDQEDRPGGFTGLHSAAYLGCMEIIVALLEMNKWDPQATDFNGNTTISWILEGEHLGVVRVLLERSEVDPDTANTKYDRTPLSRAGENGHEGIMWILLQ